MCGELAASHSRRLEAKARWKGEQTPVNRPEEAGFRTSRRQHPRPSRHFTNYFVHQPQRGPTAAENCTFRRPFRQARLERVYLCQWLAKTYNAQLNRKPIVYQSSVLPDREHRSDFQVSHMGGVYDTTSCVSVSGTVPKTSDRLRTRAHRNLAVGAE
jgi:hypothetical protein